MSTEGTVEAGRKPRLVAARGSYAATRLRELARIAARAEEELDRIMGPGAPDAPLRLIDPVDGDPPPGVVVVRPETSSADVVRALVDRRLEDKEVPGILRTGLAVAAAQNVGALPPREEAEARLRAGIAAGRVPSIFDEVDPAVAGSFVAFLSQEFGRAALATFIERYEASRPDQAAQTAFHRPVGSLEEAWIGQLRQPAHVSPLRAFLGQIVPLLKPNWKRQAELGLYRLFHLGYGLLIPLAGKYLIDTVIPRGEVKTLVVFVSVLGAFYIVSALIQLRSAYVQGWLNLHILTRLQEQMFEHLQRLSHDFYSRAKVGDIMTRLTGDMQIVQMAMTTVAHEGIPLILTALSAAVALFILSPLLGALVLVVVPLFLVSYVALQKRFRRASYERQRIAGETTNLVQENLSAQTVVKAYGMERTAMEAFSARLNALFTSSLRLNVIGSVFQTSMTLASTFGQMLVFGVGGYLVIQGSLTVGTMLAFIALIPNLFTPLAALSGVGQQIEMASGSMRRITEFLEEPVTIADPPDARDLPPLSRAIAFENVGFGYGGARTILKDLDLTIEAGTHVAIVGPSGSGKSTVVNLLLRFWDPDSGRVTFDGLDLRDASLASLRSQIGMVFQDTFLFDTTVRQNIAIGRPDATDEEIAAAARAAALEPFIAQLPAGYDTVLGERGVRMSGGQRQRLAIARALLRSPRILVLDEATSALDAQTEQEIIATLLELVRGRTTLTITHRLALAARADRIVVLTGGVVAESGTHDELLALDGIYRRLYDEQMGLGPRGAPVVQIARLREVPLFDGLGLDLLNEVALRLTPERFAPGDDIVRQGEAGDRFYVLASGRADVTVSDELGERLVNVLREGDFFGELALLAGERRTATVRAAEPTLVYGLGREDLALLMDTEPRVRTEIERAVAARRGRFDLISS